MTETSPSTPPREDSPEALRLPWWWPQFGLRTFLIAVSIVGVIVGLIAREVHSRRSHHLKQEEIRDLWSNRGATAHAQTSLPATWLSRFYPTEWRSEYTLITFDNWNGHPPRMRSLGDAETRKRLLSSLQSTSRLTTLDFSHTDFGDEDVAHLKWMPFTHYLVLNHTQITDDGLKDLASIDQFRALRIDRAAVSPVGIRHLLAMPKLSSLHVSRSQLGDLKQLLQIPRQTPVKIFYESGKPDRAHGYTTTDASIGLWEPGVMREAFAFNLSNSKFEIIGPWTSSGIRYYEDGSVDFGYRRGRPGDRNAGWQ